MAEGREALARLLVVADCVPVREGAPLHILPRQPHMVACICTIRPVSYNTASGNLLLVTHSMPVQERVPLHILSRQPHIVACHTQNGFGQPRVDGSWY